MRESSEKEDKESSSVLQSEGISSRNHKEDTINQHEIWQKLAQRFPQNITISDDSVLVSSNDPEVFNAAFEVVFKIKGNNDPRAFITVYREVIPGNANQRRDRYWELICRFHREGQSPAQGPLVAALNIDHNHPAKNWANFLSIGRVNTFLQWAIARFEDWGDLASGTTVVDACFELGDGYWFDSQVTKK
eukprot:TRINITY_DN7686_c0_g2_i3.p1 TRINITY_DN7686_c0_g2~~TRINITY_DN7686_c0_g2_i3.p1  ORF type:complete len:190 (-),score=23.34 TRINITY_DN7686_c0_g2_i3:441-1010(-)